MAIKNYEVTGRVARFSAGVVSLSHAQASSRIHNLKDLGKGEYEIVNPIEFKNGELFGYSGDVPKVMASAVEMAGPAGAPGEGDELKELSVKSLKKLNNIVGNIPGDSALLTYYFVFVLIGLLEKIHVQVCHRTVC